ncbi:hypothetical protein LBMAG36_11560 [Chlorobiota bacterium]|nr:hypothetical protein LBMAG36_11560 [Chlorobiota bacterium]
MFTNRTANNSHTLMANIGEAEIIKPILVGMNKRFYNVDRHSDVNAVISIAAMYADKAISKETHK